MLEQTMVLHCRSVMAGIKTANLFSYKFTDSKELTDEIRRLNGVCVPKGLRIVILSISENRALIYAYRISKLREDFKDRLANSMLTRRSYSVNCPETCIKQLAEKIRPGCDFPHEIGLFLGYPPEDVYGFITNHADCAKCVGAWKVYGDEDRAKKKFRQYEKCKKVYCKYYSRFNSFGQLVVAV